MILRPGAFFALILSGFIVPATAAVAQAPASSPTAVAPFDEATAAALQQQAATLRKQAQASPTGLASVTLKKYPGHFTMLTVRTRSGGAELHEHFSDIFFVLSGEATEVTGGTIPDSSSKTPGEVRGAAVVGGTPHPMRAGDIVHIAPGTPHQTLVKPGEVFTYYVIKVEQP